MAVKGKREGKRYLANLTQSQAFAVGCLVRGEILTEEELISLANKSCFVIAVHGKVLKALKDLGYVTELRQDHFRLTPHAGVTVETIFVN
jgi:hypothetical protein